MENFEQSNQDDKGRTINFEKEFKEVLSKDITTEEKEIVLEIFAENKHLI